MSNLEDLVVKIVEKGAKRVLVQLPEGLLARGPELHKILSRVGVDAFISLEPCYGACDLRDCEAERLGCGLLIHVGHSDFGLKSRVPVLYYEWRIDWDPVPIIEKNLNMLPEKIGLVSSVNFLGSLAKAKKFLESRGKKCFIGKGPSYPGQILGCNVEGALELEKSVECYLYVGSGKFHPLGLALKTEKPVFNLNADNNILEKFEIEKFVRQREAAKALARDCKRFGILVSTKPGQANSEKALEIKKRLESEGKKATIFTMDCITPEKLEWLGMDCYVNTACPRIAMENRASFRKPIINLYELENGI